MLTQPANKLAFTRFLCLFPKIGAKTADRIWGKVGGDFEAEDPAKREALNAAIPKAAQEKWAPIGDLIDRCFTEGLLSAGAAVVQEFIDLFYDRYSLDNFENYERRIDNLRGLCDNIDQYESLGQFLDEMSLLTNLDDEPVPGFDDKDTVFLSTIHQAKGLEWKVVFIIWLVEGMFPSGRALEEDPLAQEERRLFYVAVTRAEDHLIMLSPKTRRQRDGGTQFYSPSRFIGELEHDACREEHVGFI